MPEASGRSGFQFRYFRHDVKARDKRAIMDAGLPAFKPVRMRPLTQ
jgi:hypothetical protein